MKKIVKIILPLFLLIILVSCASSTKDTFINKESGNELELTLAHSKDKMISITTKMTISYITIGVKDKKEAEEKINDYFPEIDINDSDTKVTYKDKEMKITSTEDLKDKKPSESNIYGLSTEKSYYSYKELEGLLVASGYEKK